jgi:PEP-CTERM motif
MRKWIGFVVFVVLIWPLSAIAQQEYSFVYTCDACSFADSTTGIGTLTWTMLASPTVDTLLPGYASGVSFEVDGVNATDQGNNSRNPVSIVFYSGSQGGGFVISGQAYASAYGPQIYTGVESAPTFILGNDIAFTDYSTSSDGVPSSLSITCVECVAPVPEPESYAMLLTGLGLLGFMARRRKQKEATAA